MKTRLAIILLFLASLACGFATKLPTEQVTRSRFEPGHFSVNVPANTEMPRVISIVTAETALTIRQRPTENSPSVGFLKHGDKVTIVGNLLPRTKECPNGWFEIEDGFVCAGFIQIRN